MPVTECQQDGKPGFRWGDEGTVYSYTADDGGSRDEARRRAFLQGFAAGETAKMSDPERDAARLLSQHLGVRKDASGNLIIGWFPSATEEGRLLADGLAVEGGLRPEELHCTILYLGDPMQYDVALVSAAVKIYASAYCWPLDGNISGLGRFVGEDDQDVIVALVDMPGLDYLRSGLSDMLWQCGVVFDSYTGHGFTPHITLAYVDRKADVAFRIDDSIPITLDSLTVAAGEAHADFEFPAPYEEQSLAPYLAERAKGMVEKAGRVLSAKNQALVLAAADALSALAEAAKRETDPEEAEKSALLRADFEAGLLEADPNAEMTYTVAKTRDEDRFTFGPLYAPERKDAHNEYIDADTLQKAIWDYVRQSAGEGRRINLQHDDSGEATLGEWVEVCSWPYETAIKVAVPGEAERELVMPAGTVYMGVIWDEKAWENGIKKGKLTGYSLGGKAVRVQMGSMDLDHMGDKLAAAKAAIEADATAEIEKAERAHLEQLDKIRDAAVADENRHGLELARANANVEQSANAVTQLVDAVKAAFTGPKAAIHVHVPEQIVNIHEADPASG